MGQACPPFPGWFGRCGLDVCAWRPHAAHGRRKNRLRLLSSYCLLTLGLGLDFEIESRTLSSTELIVNSTQFLVQLLGGRYGLIIGKLMMMILFVAVVVVLVISFFGQ